MRIAPFLLAAAAAYAESSTDVLARARSKILASLGRMPNYTCVQTLSRDQFIRNRPWPTCGGEQAEPGAGISITRGRRSGDTRVVVGQGASSETTASSLKPWFTDRFRLDVRVGSDGREIYSWAGARQFDKDEMQQIVGTGALTSGSFGPFLINIFGQKETRFTDDGSETVDGRRLLRFGFRVPAEASRYDFRTAGGSGFIAYDGALWIDAVSADLVRLDVHSAAMPHHTGVCEVHTSTEFHQVRVGGRAYLLPGTSSAEISTLPGHYVNTVTYSGCREYTSESTIRFGDEGAPAAVAATAGSSKSIPRRLRVVLALEQEIDTRTSAAGDMVSARVAAAVADKKSKRVIVPAGAIAQGRIIRLEHQWDSPAQYVIAIEWQSLTLGGATVPFTAALASGASSFTVNFADLLAGAPVRKPTNLSGGRALVFRTNDENFVVPRGYESKWETR